jgi:hypothetical protein
VGREHGRTIFRVPDRGSGNPTPLGGMGPPRGTASATLYGLPNIGSLSLGAMWGSDAVS